MIPVKLRMRNFMPYRDASLDFTGIHLGVITGDNGNGKSAIIDAMTWALWGKARAASDDDLIHSSQIEMEVEFDFKIGDQLYRIIRKRSRPKKKTGAGQSILEFHIRNGDGFRPITGNTIPQTQEKIISVLHMDYDTFINSAYLRQGHADEFTRQPPARRKEVLANILGLAVYDALEDKARELAKAHESDNAQLENMVNEINNELARKAEFLAELEKAEILLNEIDLQAKEKESSLNDLRQKKQLLERIKSQLDELQESINSKARDLRRWEEQSDQHSARIKKYEAIIARREDIETGYARCAEIKKQVDELDRKFRQSINLEKQKNLLEKKIDKDKNELLTEHTITLHEINRMEALTNTLPELKNRMAQAQVKAAKLAEAENLLKQKDQAVCDAQTAVTMLEADVPRLEKEILEVGDKIKMIAGHIAAHTEARCPLCERELSREGIELIAAKFQKERLDKIEILSRTRAEINLKKAQADALQAEKIKFEADLNEEKNRINKEEAIIRQKLKEADENLLKVSALKTTAKIIEQRLAARDFAVAEQQALAALEAEIIALGYDQAMYDAVCNQYKELGPYEREKSALNEAEQLIEQEKEAAARAQEAIHGLQEGLKRDNVKKDILSDELTTLPQISRQLAEAESEYQIISQQRSQAQEAVGSIRARLQQLAELETKKKEYEARIAELAKEESIYRELAKAFGKNGIQALIIKTALPEIAEEANRLLARLTDNRMSVKFEPQRVTKKDTVKETLDITIADELGTRNYEMFSGGEAFRINFAIRIALSRLLARRAGAPLPTLIIDEGFGTQDSTGMEKLKEAINSIQDDFDKVLVITHMDDLKEAFPARIDVVKTADGSTITVS